MGGGGLHRLLYSSILQDPERVDNLSGMKMIPKNGRKKRNTSLLILMLIPK